VERLPRQPLTATSSLLKFIEANCHLAPVSDRSRDHVPNPVATKSNPDLPLNTLAIGHLMALFKF
jgi:phospholipase C